MPWGSQLAGKLEDKKEQKSGSRKEGREIAYTGDVSIQGARLRSGINSIAFNSQTIKTEANTIENVASGEITNEANWISSFLNSGRFEIVAVFNPESTVWSIPFVCGAIVDITTDLPIPGLAPPTQTNLSGASMPASMNDILMGSAAGVHSTFIASPTGVIAEFVPTGALLNQVATGLIHTGVGTGYMATGLSRPHQVYGLAIAELMYDTGVYIMIPTTESTYLEHIWVNIAQRTVKILDNEGVDEVITWKFDEEGAEVHETIVEFNKNIPEDLITYLA